MRTFMIIIIIFGAISNKGADYKQMFNYKWLITIGLILKLGSGFLDYDQKHTLSCHNIPPDATLSSTLQILWNITILHYIDRILFLVVCPILIACQLVVVLTYAKFPSLFNKPGDIFFGLLVSEILLTIHLLMTAIYYTIFSTDDPAPPSFVPFCISISVIQSLFLMMELQYMFYFLIYAVLTTKTSLKQRNFLFGPLIHVIFCAVAVGVTLFFWFDDFLGLNNEGLCAITAVRKGGASIALPGIGLFLSIMFVALGAFSWWYFRKHIPRAEGLQKRRYYENKIISVYVGGVSVFLSLYMIIGLAMYLNCFQENPQPALTVWASIQSFLAIGQYIFLLGLMLTNQLLRKKVLKMLRRIFMTEDLGNSQIQMSYRFEEINAAELGLNQKILQLRDQQQVIDLLKVAQIITVLAGIHISHKEYLRNFDFGRGNDEVLKKIYFKETINFSLGPQILTDYKIETQILPKIGILEGTMTIHAPRVFKKLLAADELRDIHKSFDLFTNYEKIYNLVEGQGGKSGQFFFFSSDNKYVLKTINNDEYQFIIENLEKFTEYYLKHPYSLLAKIYGIYTIKGNLLEHTYHLILMRNILGCSRSQVIRTYDMKGSKHDREVIKARKKYKYNQFKHLTLKDTDFVKLEGKLNISQYMVKEFRNIIRRDSHFLKSLNLIDYSLLVVRIYWPSASKDLEKHNESSQEAEQEMQMQTEQQRQRQLSNLSIMKRKNKSNFQTFHKYQQIQSTEDPDEYYHIGIIDYMQKWDFQKKGEKWWKTLIGGKQVSAQEPNHYHKRFMNFVDQITFTNRMSALTLVNHSQPSSELSSNTDSKKSMSGKEPHEFLDQISEAPEEPHE